MKKTKRTLVIILVLIMVLSISVFAAWNQYQGNDNHNGQITDATPPVSPSPAVTTAPLYYNGGGWSGVDTPPVMEEYGGNTYAYVTYNGRSYGTQLAKIKCDDATRVWSIQIANGSANVLSTPYLDSTNGIIYVAAVDYYNAMSDPEFIVENNDSPWSRTGNASIHVEYDPNDLSPIEDESYVTIPSGGTIYQDFTYPLTSSTQTQLTSAIKLSSGSSATVTYTLTKPNNSTVTLDTKTVTSSTNWVYVNALGSGDVSATGTYTITVSVTGGSVIIDYVTYSRTSPGVKAVDRNGNIINSNVASATYGGQINTPITIYGNYMYFGTYNGQFKYYQVDISKNDPTKHTKVFTGNNHFYWTGAYVTGGYVYFGGDGGKFYRRSVSDFEDTGTTYDLTAIVSNAGNVRCTPSCDGTYLFFTSQGGYVWRYTISDGSLAYAIIGSSTKRGSSTSTPAITSSGYLYVGSYGVNHKGIFKIEKTFTSGSTLTKLTATDGLPVQASPIVYTTDGTDYIFFTTNVTGGRGYCYSCPSTGYTATYVWDTGSGNFTLQGMAAWNGYLTFGNDANTFYVVKAN